MLTCAKTSKTFLQWVPYRVTFMAPIREWQVQLQRIKITFRFHWPSFIFMDSVSTENMLRMAYSKFLNANSLYERVILQNNLDYIVLKLSATPTTELTKMQILMISSISKDLDEW
eukprot:NODE_915_length_3098_cov_0.232077.p1 type:complete len:115 gc:universal NODE_915_length_3098_cov_0.232077:1938-1594(-)